MTACRFCNEARNRTSYEVEGKSPEEIIALKLKAVSAARAEYETFWRDNVASEP